MHSVWVQQITKHVALFPLILGIKRLLPAYIRADSADGERYRSFIATHLIGGGLAVVFLLTYLIQNNAQLGPVLWLAPWICAPIAIAIYLIKTGQLERAHLASAAALVGLVTFAAAMTGGLNSFIIAWLILVPVEAALADERRVMTGATILAGVAMLGLYAAELYGLLPAPALLATNNTYLHLVGIGSALIYAVSISVVIESAHRKANNTIDASRARYRLLAENATDVITRHDRFGQVLFASHAANDVLHSDPHALLGDGLLTKVHLCDRPSYLKMLMNCASEGRPSALEFRIAAPVGENSTDLRDDGFIWVEMRCQSVAQEAPADRCASSPALNDVVAVTRDVTYRRTHERELCAARDAAEKANIAKTRFLANMSHELRTPLNAIIGFAQILMQKPPQKSYDDDNTSGEYLGIIAESGEHLLSVVNGLLDMSRIEAGHYKIYADEFDVRELVRGCCRIVRKAADDKSITISTEFPEMPDGAAVVLCADKRACGQMLLNLLANAVKFGRQGGNVAVVVRHRGPLIIFDVTDDGIGISANDIAKLGKPFVQADNALSRQHEGTGLGLSIVEGLAKLHGGSLKISSELGTGTTMSILLPVDGSEANQRTAKDATHENSHIDNVTQFTSPKTIAQKQPARTMTRAATLDLAEPASHIQSNH